MGSLGILQIDNRCEEGQSSYRSSVYWFMAAVGIQLAMGIIAITMKRDPEGRRDNIIKTCGFAVAGITVYLLVYFFIYQDGCEELIKFWVLANLLISIAFTGLRMFYIFVKLGKEGLRKAISKNTDSKEKSQIVGNSLDTKRTTFKLGEDFYSLAFYSYILM